MSLPASRLSWAALLLVVGATGCAHAGSRIGEHFPEIPRGATVRLRLPAGALAVVGWATVRGELILVTDAFVLLGQHDRYLAIAPGEVIESWIGPHHTERSRRQTTAGLPPLEVARLYARHPHGLSRDEVAAVMAADGIDRLVFVRSVTDPLREVSPDSLPGLSAGRAREPASPLDQPGVAAFLDSLRTAGARFQSVDDAIAAGYRKLGPAFPGMGEHWIHPGRVVSGRVDPTAPSVLAFATIGGERRLIAAAFTVPLAPGERPPTYPAGAGVWHDHADRVDEELLLLAHPASHMAAGERPRLAMFHAWMWLENPAGVFAQNNWTLPFAQAGLDVERAPSPDAARALSLLTAGRDYYMALFTAAGPPSPEEGARLAALLDRYAREVEEWREGATSVGREGIVELEARWLAFWQDVRNAVGEPTWERLSPLAGDRARLAAVRRIRLTDLRVVAAVGAGLYHADGTPAAFSLGVRLTLARRTALRAHFEQLETRGLGQVCFTRCYSMGDGHLRFWTLGLDFPLATVAGERAVFVGTLGVGRGAVRVGGESLGDVAAFYLSARGDVVVHPAVTLLAEAGTYMAELPGIEGGLYPAIRAGIAVGIPRR